MAPGKLTQLVIDRVDLVDQGANQHAHIKLMKSAEDPEVTKAIDAYMKREFSAEDRKSLASSGAALPDGSFPIADKEDLHNAMRAIGRAKDPSAAKAHIRSRAKTLGLTAELSDAFKRRTLVDLLKALFAKDSDDSARNFDAVHGATEAGEFADGMMSEICEMVGDLRTSVCEIMADDGVADKQAALNETFQQFQTAIQGVVPEEMEKALAAELIAAGFTVGAAGVHKGVIAMTDVEKAAAEAAAKAAHEKSLADMKAAKDKSDQDADDAKKALAKALFDIAVLKMGADHQEFLAKSTMSDTDKAAFVAKSADERAAVIKAAAPVLPAEIQKALDENQALKKRLEAVEKRDSDALVAKRAGELGLAADQIETLAKAYIGDKDAIEKLFGAFTGQITELKKSVATLEHQVKKAGLFGEIGTAKGSDVSDAIAKMAIVVADIRKANPKMRSDAQALAKVSEDPSHSELWHAYKAARDEKKAA